MEIMVNSILVVANDGREELIDVNPDKDLAHIIKSYRKPENRMVCIIEDGTRILRWAAAMLPVPKITGVR